MPSSKPDVVCAPLGVQDITDAHDFRVVPGWVAISLVMRGLLRRCSGGGAPVWPPREEGGTRKFHSLRGATIVEVYHNTDDRGWPEVRDEIDKLVTNESA